MILRKFKEYKRGAKVQADSGLIVELIEGINSDTATYGFYTTIDNRVIALYKTEDYRIFIHLNDHTFEFDEYTVVAYSKDESKCTLSISSKDRKEHFEYIQSQEPVSTPWYTESEEDVNIGLWIYNLLNSEERINIFLQKE